MNILDPLPNDRILSLLLTLRCTAECMHCGTLSSPRVRSRLAADDARRMIDEAASSGYKLVVFTGGEPMLYGLELYDLIKRADEAGLSTRVVTNGFWAKSTRAATQGIVRLTDAGLREINFSTGDQHAKFVSVEHVIRGARAAVDARLPVSLMIEVVAEATISKRAITEHPIFKELFDETSAELVNFCESPWMPLEADSIFEYPPGLAANAGNIGERVGCDSIVNTTTVLADGRIMACCGLGTQSIPALEVGHITRDTLAVTERRIADDFLKRWIKVEGPEKILAWAASIDPSIKWEDMYAHRCQACKRLYADGSVRAVIAAHHQKKIADVLFKEWLLFHFESTVGQGNKHRQASAELTSQPGTAESRTK